MEQEDWRKEGYYYVRWDEIHWRGVNKALIATKIAGLYMESWLPLGTPQGDFYRGNTPFQEMSEGEKQCEIAVQECRFATMLEESKNGEGRYHCVLLLKDFAHAWVSIIAVMFFYHVQKGEHYHALMPAPGPAEGVHKNLARVLEDLTFVFNNAVQFRECFVVEEAIAHPRFEEGDALEHLYSKGKVRGQLTLPCVRLANPVEHQLWSNLGLQKCAEQDFEPIWGSAVTSLSVWVSDELIED